MTDRADTEPSPPPSLDADTDDTRPLGPPKLPRATHPPQHRIDEPRPAATRPPIAAPAEPRPARLGPLAAPPQRASKLPYVRQEIGHPPDERNYTPAKLPRATGEQIRLTRATEGRGDTARLPEVDLGLSSPRLRVRGTPNKDVAAGEQIRTMVYAPEPARAAWIERELSHPPITIQVGRRVRTVVAALVRDPPPRPDVLIVDFDALSPVELLELHAIRQEGWFGRLIGIGNVPAELCISLGIDHVFAEPLIRDSLLDCVAGTNHAVTTTACPVIPDWDDRS